MDRALVRRVFVAAALAGVVAAAAGGASAWAPLRLGKPGSVALVLTLSLALGLGVAGAWSLALILDRGASRGGSGPYARRPSPSTLRRVFPAAVVIVALVGLQGISRLTLGATRDPVGQVRPDSEGREGRLLRFTDDRDVPVRRGGKERPLVPVLDGRPVPLAAALLIFLVGGAALAWWLVGRRAAGDGAEARDRLDTEAARNTVLRSIEGMLADPDPNTAVIGAYARLLEGLAASGVPRRDYEAPMEHLRRALSHLPVRPGPVQRLVDLFQVARFSTQVLTSGHRDEALGALRDVASDLNERIAATAAPAPSRSRRVRS